MTVQEVSRELADTAALLPKGCKPVFLRPPGGSIGPSVTQAAAQAGLAVLNWSVDPKDWATRDASVVQAAVVEQVRDGDVILLHDMSDSSVDAALSIVDDLQARGFRFVTASQLAAGLGVTPKAGTVYCRFD